MQGFRSFTRFKIFSNKNGTTADKSIPKEYYRNNNNNNININQFPDGNPWVEIYKDIFLPNSFNIQGNNIKKQEQVNYPNNSDNIRCKSFDFFNVNKRIRKKSSEMNSIQYLSPKHGNNLASPNKILQKLSKIQSCKR